MLRSALILLLAICQYAAFTQEINLTVQTGHSASINKLSFSTDGTLLASAGSDNNIVLWDIAAGRQLITLSRHTRKVNDVVFHPHGKYLISGSDDGKVIVWDFKTGTVVRDYTFEDPVKSLSVSPDGRTVASCGKKVRLINLDTHAVEELGFTTKQFFTTIAFTNNGSAIAFGGRRENSIRLYRIDDKKLVGKYSLQALQVVFSADDQYLIGAGANGKMKKWDIKASRLFSSYAITADRIWQSYTCTAVSGQYFIGGNRNALINLFSLTSGKKKAVLNGHLQDVKALAISPDEKFLVSAGLDRKIIFWDLGNFEITKVLEGSTEKVNTIAFAEKGQSMVLGYGDGSFRYWNFSPGGEMTSNQLSLSKLKRFLRWENTITDIKKVDGRNIEFQAYRIRRFKKNDEYVKAKGFKVKWDVTTNTIRTSGKSKLKNITADELLNPKNLTSASGEYIANLKETGELELKRGASVVFSQSPQHTDKVTSVVICNERNMIATSGLDGLVKLWDINNGALLSNVLATNESDFIFITPENYYFSTKGALEHIGFRVGTNIYSFEQFDLKYNRPDLVFSKLKHADTTVTYAYFQAYNKRIQKANLQGGNLVEFDDIPTVVSSDKLGTLSSKTRHYKFSVAGKAGKSKIDKVFVSVNGVPVFPSGLPYHEGHSKEIEIELSYGVNKVVYYIVNEKGVSSLRQSFQVTYKEGKLQPDLYLITIGASQYKQNTFDLKYAAKDAQDIEALFRSSRKFNDIKKITLLNENVTVENIRALEKFIAQARVDDMVLITYAGHGVLDKDLNYFLSTYHTDFNDPINGGLAFNDMEKILENIKARNKILLVDACHSGEIDKDEVELTTSVTTDAGNISFRNVGNSVRNKSGAGLKTSFELSKALFADVKTNHGAVIISSAGGGEYAIEGKDWKNGIFTYCFIDGLKNKKSDLNKDGKISISEIQRYLAVEVPKVTGGKQTPTSREENLSNNFIIW